VHLVGIIIRIYHDARASECQTGVKSFYCYNSHEVSLCDGRIYVLYVDATFLLARYIFNSL